MVTETTKQSSEIPFLSLTQTRFAATYRECTRHSIQCTRVLKSCHCMRIHVCVCVCVPFLYIKYTPYYRHVFFFRCGEVRWYDAVQFAIYFVCCTLHTATSLEERMNEAREKKTNYFLSLTQTEKNTHISFVYLNVTTHFFVSLYWCQRAASTRNKRCRMRQSISCL